MALWIISLSWTLLWSLTQGAMIYAGMRLSLVLLNNAPARWRYNISLGAMALLAGWFPFTLWQQLKQATPAWAGANVYHIYTYVSNGNGPGDNNLAITLLPWLGIAYLPGVAIMAIRLAASTLQLTAFRSTGNGPADEDLVALLPKLKIQLQIPQQVTLRSSVKAKVPMVIGIFRPVILLPAAITNHLSMQELETIVLHELAHIKRHDFLINILQTIIETVLFFNPFVWLISANIRREREFCCDEMVVRYTGTPQLYANALYTLATAEAPSSLAIAASPSPNYLLKRIKRIMETKKNSFSYSRMVAAVVVIAGIACSIAWLTPTLGAKDKGDDKPAAKPATISRTSAPTVSEQEQLAQRLMADKLVDEAKGFIVERKQQELFVNGQAIPAERAARYMDGLKQQYMRIQVHSFEDRIKMHPDANIMQLVFPETFKSECIDNGPQQGKKDGC